MMDNRGTVAFCNEAGQRVFGYSEQEARGKKLNELIVRERNRVDFAKKFIEFGTTGQGPVVGKTVSLALPIVSACAIENAKQTSFDDTTFWCQLISCDVVVPIVRR